LYGIGICVVLVSFVLTFEMYIHTYILVHTYHSHFIPKGVAKASQIYLRNAHVLPKYYLAMRNTADVSGGNPIAGAV
jgi:hypothetical protein